MVLSFLLVVVVVEEEEEEVDVVVVVVVEVDVVVMSVVAAATVIVWLFIGIPRRTTDCCRILRSTCLPLISWIYLQTQRHGGSRDGMGNLGARTGGCILQQVVVYTGM